MLLCNRRHGHQGKKCHHHQLSLQVQRLSFKVIETINILDNNGSFNNFCDEFGPCVVVIIDS
jgi:hypothetical protein